MLATQEWLDVNHLQGTVVIHNENFSWTQEYQKSMIAAVNQFTDKMAEKDQSADYYGERRNASRPLADIKFGKFGELTGALFLRTKGWPKVLPDFSVRTGVKKGWDCDLPFNKINKVFPGCHVKTCNEKTRQFAGEYTWTFQWENTSGVGGRDPLFMRPDSNELVLLMYVPSLDENKAVVVATAPWNKIHGILRDPISDKLKGLKKCLYYEDLINL